MCYALCAEIHKTQGQDSSSGEDATSEPHKAHLKIEVPNTRGVGDTSSPTPSSERSAFCLNNQLK